MGSYENTFPPSTAVGSPESMTAQDLMAVARAEQDWRDGLSADENPFPPGSSEFKHYQEEFDRLMIAESVRDLSAA